MCGQRACSSVGQSAAFTPQMSSVRIRPGPLLVPTCFSFAFCRRESRANLVNNPSRSALVAHPLQDQCTENSQYQREDGIVFHALRSRRTGNETFISKKPVMTAPIVARRRRLVLQGQCVTIYCVGTASWGIIWEANTRVWAKSKSLC